MPLDPLKVDHLLKFFFLQVTLLARALPDMTHLTELVVPYIATNRSLLNIMKAFTFYMTTLLVASSIMAQ